MSINTQLKTSFSVYSQKLIKRSVLVKRSLSRMLSISRDAVILLPYSLCLELLIWSGKREKNIANSRQEIFLNA
jgi:hypothetical protein